MSWWNKLFGGCDHAWGKWQRKNYFAQWRVCSKCGLTQERDI